MLNSTENRRTLVKKPIAVIPISPSNPSTKFVILIRYTQKITTIKNWIFKGIYSTSTIGKLINVSDI